MTRRPAGTPAAGARVGAVAAALATIEAREGGPPVAVVARCDAASDGARVLVYDDGSHRGSLGDPALDAAALELGAAVLRDPDGGPRASVLPRPTVRNLVAPTPSAPDPATADDPVAGSAGAQLDAQAQLYAEAHHPPGRLFIVGAGHIALPLAQLGVLLGFPVVVLDDREEFATDTRFPGASRVLRVDFADPFDRATPGPADAVVLVTRAHRYDYDCLLRLVDTDRPPRYIGMVGSRRRVRAAFSALLEAGVGRDRLAAVHAPIGVDIGAETPEEIALSIAAELVAVRRGVEPGGSLRDRERVVERFLAEETTDGS